MGQGQASAGVALSRVRGQARLVGRTARPAGGAAGLRPAVVRAFPRGGSRPARRWPPRPLRSAAVSLALRGLCAAARLSDSTARVSSPAPSSLLALGGFVPVISRLAARRDRDLGRRASRHSAASGSSPRRTTPTPTSARRSSTAMPPCCSQPSTTWRGAWARRPPQQVRLSYLPCCGVVAWGRSQALMLGLPLLHVLTLAELRAVLAHELAHLARGDATRSARSARFVAGPGAGARPGLHRLARSPLRLWAAALPPPGRLAARPDRPRPGGPRRPLGRRDRRRRRAAASALVKVALVQPLFREVLEHYDPTDPELPTSTPSSATSGSASPNAAHRDAAPAPGGQRRDVSTASIPPCPTASPSSSPIPHRRWLTTDASAKTALGDLEALEQMLHNRLFSTPGIEPSVFHRAGT